MSPDIRMTPDEGVVAWGGARPAGCFPAGEALADAAIKTTADAAAVAQADTLSDGDGKAAKGTGDPETLPAG